MREYEELAVEGLKTLGSFVSSGGGYRESPLPIGGGTGICRRALTGGGAADMMGIGGASKRGGLC